MTNRRSIDPSTTAGVTGAAGGLRRALVGVLAERGSRAVAADGCGAGRVEAGLFAIRFGTASRP